MLCNLVMFKLSDKAEQALSEWEAGLSRAAPNGFRGEGPLKLVKSFNLFYVFGVYLLVRSGKPSRKYRIEDLTIPNTLSNYIFSWCGKTSSQDSD